MDSARRAKLWASLGILVVACGQPPGAPVSATPPTIPAQVETYAPTHPEIAGVVESFLRAEAAGDFITSFGYLSAADQASFGSPEGWQAEHFFLLPEIAGFAITADEAAQGEAEVEVDLALKPSLDQLNGLTPADATSIWRLRAEEGGWGIALTESEIFPVYLDDVSAPTDVQAWADAMKSCPRAPGPNQWERPLLGSAVLVADLCGARGQVRVGEPEPLSDAAESQPFLAAFGPDVGRWARVVSVLSPQELRVVVAPIGNHWQVIGVIDPTP